MPTSYSSSPYVNSANYKGNSSSSRDQGNYSSTSSSSGSSSISNTSSSGSNPTPYSGNQPASGSAAGKSNDTNSSRSQDPEFSSKTSSTKLASNYNASPYIQPVVYSDPQSAVQSGAYRSGRTMVTDKSTGRTVVVESSPNASSVGAAALGVQQQTAGSATMQGASQQNAQATQAMEANFSSIYGVPGVATGTGSQTSVTLLAKDEAQKQVISQQIESQKNQVYTPEQLSRGNFVTTSGEVQLVEYPSLSMQWKDIAAPKPQDLKAPASDMSSVAYYSTQKIDSSNVDPATQAYGKYVAYQTQQDKLTMGGVSSELRSQGTSLASNIDLYTTQTNLKRIGMAAAIYGGGLVLAEVGSAAVAGSLASSTAANAAITGTALQVAGGIVAGQVIKSAGDQVASSVKSFNSSPIASANYLADIGVYGLSGAAAIQTSAAYGGRPVSGLAKSEQGVYGEQWKFTTEKYYEGLPKFEYTQKGEAANYKVTDVAIVDKKAVVSMDYAPQRTLYGDPTTKAEIVSARAGVDEQVVFAPKYVTDSAGNKFYTEGIYKNTLKIPSEEANQLLFKPKITGVGVYNGELVGVNSRTTYPGQPVPQGSTNYLRFEPGPSGKQSSLVDFGINAPFKVVKPAADVTVYPPKTVDFGLIEKNYAGSTSSSGAARLNLQNPEFVDQFREVLAKNSPSYAFEQPKYYTIPMQSVSTPGPSGATGPLPSASLGIVPIGLSGSSSQYNSPPVLISSQDASLLVKQSTGFGSVNRQAQVVSSVQVVQPDVMVKQSVQQQQEEIKVQVIDFPSPPPPSPVPPEPPIPPVYNFESPPPPEIPGLKPPTVYVLPGGGGGSGRRGKLNTRTGPPRKSYKPSIIGLQLGLVTPGLAKSEALTGLEIRGLPSKGAKVWSTAPPARTSARGFAAKIAGTLKTTRKGGTSGKVTNQFYYKNASPSNRLSTKFTTRNEGAVQEQIVNRNPRLRGVAETLNRGFKRLAA